MVGGWEFPGVVGAFVSPVGFDVGPIHSQDRVLALL